MGGKRGNRTCGPPFLLTRPNKTWTTHGYVDRRMCHGYYLVPCYVCILARNSIGRD